MTVKLRIKFINDDQALVLNFNTEEERDKCFDSLTKSMSKVTLDVWTSNVISLKCQEISYIEKPS